MSNKAGASGGDKSDAGGAGTGTGAGAGAAAAGGAGTGAGAGAGAGAADAKVPFQIPAKVKSNLIKRTRLLDTL